MRTPFKVLFVATIIAIFAVAGFETIDYLFGPLITFYVMAGMLVVTGFSLAGYQLYMIRKNIKEREERWKY